MSSLSSRLLFRKATSSSSMDDVENPRESLHYLFISTRNTCLVLVDNIVREKLIKNHVGLINRSFSGRSLKKRL